MASEVKPSTAESTDDRDEKLDWLAVRFECLILDGVPFAEVGKDEGLNGELVAFVVVGGSSLSPGAAAAECAW